MPFPPFFADFFHSRPFEVIRGRDLNLMPYLLLTFSFDATFLLTFSFKLILTKNSTKANLSSSRYRLHFQPSATQNWTKKAQNMPK